MHTTGMSTTALRLQTPKGRLFFAPGSIIRLESESNYTYVHFSDRKPLLVAKVLREFEDLLEPFGFLRIHRSHIINPEHITRIDEAGGVRLADDFTASVSRRRRRAVEDALQRRVPAA
jgi:two-component system LytT family response regulator